ncbi:MAG: Fe2+-dependent dioxygenase [Alphaproteobacteria bacterium]
MLMCISNLLTPEETARLRAIAGKAEFDAGTLTAGRNIHDRKNNLQISDNAAGRDDVDQIVLQALQRNALFQSVALPKSVHRPTLSIYKDGMTYGSHVDAAIMNGMRADVSITIFLKDPTSYDGGELTLVTGAGEQAIKLMPGDAVVYPTSAFHWVSPVTRGERLAAVTWAQSIIADADKRTVLHDLRMAIEQATRDTPDSETIHLLVKTHANLMRMWAEI